MDVGLRQSKNIVDDRHLDFVTVAINDVIITFFEREIIQ